VTARLVAVAVAVAMATGCGGDEPERADLLLTAARVFDGREVIADGAVAVTGSEIVAVGTRDDVEVEARRTIALGDATLLPGLVDLHVHGLGSGQLDSAVTTVRDVGTAEANLPVERELPGRLRLLVAGPLLTTAGGYPIPIHGSAVGGVVRNPADGRRFVRRLADNGAAVIKIALQHGFPMLSRAEVEAIVDEAHRLDLRVTAHVGHVADARLALESGVDELAHMPCGRDDALMKALAEAGVEIVGTLHVIRMLVGCPELLESVRAFVRARGTLLYGSDYGNPGIPTGVDVAELLLMERAGLSTLEVLVNATSRAGEQTGVEGIGRLEEGAPADLVAVRGDVRDDLAKLLEPTLVVVRGRLARGPA
jgi:imidazolonepropionase-like amidohydrolase